MIGALVPVAMLPRFTSHVGAGTYATVPLDVREFAEAELVFWRGPLVGGAAVNPFRTWFEESHDVNDWTEALLGSGSQPVTQANATGSYRVFFSRRWFRVRVELAGDVDNVVGITLWMAGGLVRRVS